MWLGSLSYSEMNISLLTLPKARQIIPSTDMAFDAAWLHCWLHFKSSDSYIPRSWQCFMCAMTLVSVSCIILYCVSKWWLIDICRHFTELNFRSHFSEYLPKFSNLFLDLIICYNLISSANILTLLVISLGMSFTYKRYNKGPKTEPWGTPLLTELHDELEPSTFTLIIL